MRQSTTYWYIVQVKPNATGRVVVNLARQGFGTFAPIRRHTATRRGRLEQATRPLFPGYLFVRVPPDRRDWRRIDNTYGVARLVGLVPGHPTNVRPDLMAALFDRCDGELWRAAPEDFAPGSTARIVAGPLASLMATIEAAPAAERIFVLLDIMGQKVRAEVTVGDLEPAGLS